MSPGVRAVRKTQSPVVITVNGEPVAEIRPLISEPRAGLTEAEIALSRSLTEFVRGGPPRRG